jgi:hypothetical protein
MKTNHTIITVAMASLLLIGCDERRQARREACKNNLRQIYSNNWQYMLEHNTERVPTFEETNMMWSTGCVPTCPAGGIYTQSRSPDDYPTCSLGDSRGHRLERISEASTSE